MQTVDRDAGVGHMPPVLRDDLALVAAHIAPTSRVLDVGCGEGDLLAYLMATKGIDGRGIELQSQHVRTCIKRGLSVLQGDADSDLTFYESGCFDYAICMHVIQATERPRAVLEELLRIGRHVVVTLPNFGYWSNRVYLGLRGRMPVTRHLPYHWYDTPNIHFCTLRDFIELTEDLGAQIDYAWYRSLSGDLCRLCTRGKRGRVWWANLAASHGVFILTRHKERTA
jgi:methionine biosynthesis protein MetW